MGEGLKAPERAFVLDLKVQADTREDLANYLSGFATEILMDKISTGVTGGYSAGAIYALRVNEGVTHDSWFEELTAYLDSLPTPIQGGSE